MNVSDAWRRVRRLLMPIALAMTALVFAVLSSRSVSPSSEAAGGLTSFAPSVEMTDPESLPHSHNSVVDESADGQVHMHDESSASVDASHQHATAQNGATEVNAPGGHVHDTPLPNAPPTGPIVSIDDPRLSPTQQNAARSLLISTRSTIAALPDVSALTAAGYVSVGDNSSGLQHWVNDAFTHDGRELDSTRIESFIVRPSTGRAVGAMYMLEPGKTMANVPDIAGELTTWHVHQPICFSTSQIWRFVSFANNGNCGPGSAVRNVPPMMHVWLDDPQCGPFVGTEGHGSSNCSAHQH